MLLPAEDRALMARTARLKQVDEHACNLGFPYSFKKHGNLKHSVWNCTLCCNGGSYDVNSVDLFCEHTRKVLGENVPEDSLEQ